MNELLRIILIIGFAYYILSIVASLVKLRSVRIRRGSSKPRENRILPPVSILKPVNGIDGNLRENLLSFVNQDYPEFEIIVGIQSAGDPALGVVQQLKAEFPEKKIQIVVSGYKLGYNPKVNNLYGMMRYTNYDCMVISDSNVIVDSDYLKSNMSYFEDERVGLVTNLIRGIGGENLGAVFENLHLNSFIFGNVSLVSLLGKQITVGKSMFFRKSQLDSLGGISELRNYLAEDYLMGRMYKRNGYRVIVSPNIVSSTNHTWTFRKFLNRHTRWGQLRWHLNKSAYFLELLSNFSFWALVYATVAGFSLGSFVTLLLFWTVKITGDAFMNATLATGIGFKECLLSPVKDILIALAWPIPLFHSSTKWRGNRVKISRDTLLIPSQK